MYAATLLSKSNTTGVADKVTVKGGVVVKFGLNQGQTMLKDLYQRDPVRVLFPDNPPGELTIGVLTTTSGGLVGGDEIRVDVAAETNTQSMIMAQAAEKIYRSAGRDCLIDITIKTEDGSWFEWLPQETILHQGARMRRSTDLQLAGTARVLAGEFLVFGRHAMGEKLSNGLVRDSWSVSIDGHLGWSDTFHIDGELNKIIDHPAGLGGARATASAVYAGPDAHNHLDFARELLGGVESVRAGASVVNGILLMRWIGADVFLLRASFANFWKKFRHHVGGQPETMPRLWDI